jgi:hypothetical protein
MVAMLGLGMIGASRRGGLDTSIVPPQLPFTRLECQLKQDDRLPIIRNSRQGEQGERVTRRAAASEASEGLREAQFTREGPQVPSPGSTV